MSLIDNTRSLTEQLISNLQLHLTEAEKGEVFSSQLTQREEQILLKEKTVVEKQESLEKEQEEVKRERQYLVKIASEVKTKETALAEHKRELETIETEDAKRKIQISKEVELLEKKRLEVSALIEREKQLATLQEVINREKAIDRERKEILDAREKRIHDREKYLERLATS